MFKKYLSRFPFALRGLKQASLYDLGFRTQIYLGVVVAFIVSAFLLPLTQTELLFIILAYALILITELQNSALESALDKLHPERSENIKNSKDMAAASVLVAGAFLVVVLLTIAWSKFIF
jgi:diacylglycerol kinase